MDIINKDLSKKAEHILVCLSSSPSNPKVIRAGAEMSEKSGSKFTALYIETDRIMNSEDQKRFEENLSLAKNLGAKIVRLNGNNIPNLVANYAKTEEVTKLVIGRSGYRPSKIFNPPSYTDKLIALIPEVEIFIIPDKVQKLYIGNKKQNIETQKFTLKDSLISLLVLILATLLGGLFHYYNIYDANIILVYILAILFISYNTKSRIYSLLSSILAVFVYNFFFVEPYFSTHFNNKNYSVTFLTMFIVALISSNIAKRMQAQAHEAVLKTFRFEHLFDLSQKLQQSNNELDIKQTLVEELTSLLDCKIQIINSSINQQKKYLYIPISNKKNEIIEIQKKNISKFEENLVNAMIRETSLAIEKNITRKINEELIIKNKQEELRTTLLRTISHDLRTPLTGISGYAELLINNNSKLSDDKKLNIYNDIYDDSIWLLNLVENLLSMTRFDKDKIQVKEEIEFIPDIIAEVLSHLGHKKENYNVVTNFSDEELYAKMDGRLISQVIFNLVDNAMKYSPINSTIEVKATKQNNGDIRISVSDNGCGITKENKEKIFNLFYTVSGASPDSRRGMGLGLALCKTVIEAHSSKIEIEDNKPNGTIISFSLKGYDYE